MKKHTLVLYVLLATTFAAAQEVVTTQGDTYANSTANIAFTIGEVVVNTVSNGNNTLTQGFHQTNWHFVSVTNHAPKFDVSIFPNPTSDVLNIKTSDYEQVNYALYNAQGKQVRQAKLITSQTAIEVSHLAPGNYTLVLQDASKLLKTFKLLKIK
jgi:hypothetical protein